MLQRTKHKLVQNRIQYNATQYEGGFGHALDSDGEEWARKTLNAEHDDEELEFAKAPKRNKKN